MYHVFEGNPKLAFDWLGSTEAEDECEAISTVVTKSGIRFQKNKEAVLWAVELQDFKPVSVFLQQPEPQLTLDPLSHDEAAEVIERQRGSKKNG